MSAVCRRVLPIFTALLVGACSTATLLDTPSTPTDLYSTAASDTEIILEWFDNSDNEIGFVMEIGLSPDVYDSSVNIEPNITLATGSDLPPGTEYYFRMYAFNFGGRSEYSNAIVIHAGGGANNEVSPVSPSNLIGQHAASGSILIAWSDNSDNEDGFLVYRSIDSTASENFSLIAQTETDVIQYEDAGSPPEGLPPVTNIFYYVLAYNSAGESGPTDITLVVSPSVSALPAPTGLTATKGTEENEIILTWHEVEEAIAYNIYSSSSADGVYAYQAFTTETSLTLDSTGTTDHFFFRVSALDQDALETDRSDYEEGWAASQTPPVKASDLTATGTVIGNDNLDKEGDESFLEIEPNTAVTLTWTDNADNEDGYVVERKAISVDSDFEPLATVALNISEYIDVTLDPGERYWYRVRATNAQGESENSNTVSVKARKVSAIQTGGNAKSNPAPGWMLAPPFSDHFSAANAAAGGPVAGSPDEKLNGLGNLFKDTGLAAALIGELTGAHAVAHLTLFFGPFVENAGGARSGERGGQRGGKPENKRNNQSSSNLPGQDHAVLLRMISGPDGKESESMKYRSGIWHKIELANIEWSTYTFDLYVNDQLIASGIQAIL